MSKVKIYGFLLVFAILCSFFGFGIIPNQASASSAAPVTKIRDTIIDQEAIGFHSGFQFINATSFQQDAIVTFNGYQYATFYRSNRYLAVARRQLPTGQWKVVELDYSLSENDSHNVAVLGISPIDGTIHIAFDHHRDSLHYIVSDPNVATNPPQGWTESIFLDSQDILNVQSTLNGTNIGSEITYPRFLLTSNNKLQFSWRRGSPGNGSNRLAEYNNGQWTDLGAFTSASGNFTVGSTTSISRNAYFNGLAYSSDRLHASWAWREILSGYFAPNHDVGYAYSDDNGRTWKNNGGTTIATTGSSQLIKITSPSLTVGTGIPIGRALMNSESMAIDNQGRPHVIVTYVPSSVEPNVIKNSWDFWVKRNNYARAFHYWRDSSGSWHNSEIGSGTTIINRAGRPKIVFDSNNNAYAILPNLRIASASAASGWSDWSIVYDADDAQFYGEPVIDMHRLQNENVLSVMIQEKGAFPHQPTAIRVLDFQLGVNQTSVPPPTSQNIAYANLAYGKPTQATNVLNSQPEFTWGVNRYGPAYFAVDGQSNTIWVAGNGVDTNSVNSPWYLTVDLDGLYTIDRVKVTSRTNYGPHCLSVRVSTNGVDYITVKSNHILSNTDNPQNIAFNSVEARYIQLQIKSSYDKPLGSGLNACTPSHNTNDRNVQIKELAVFGTKVNLAFRENVTAKSQKYNPYPPDYYGPAQYAVDGQLNTTWVAGDGNNTNNFVAPPWYLTVDLNDVQRINKVEIVPRVNYGPHCLSVRVSTNGINYSTIEPNYILGNSQGSHTITFTTTNARYVQLQIKSSYDKPLGSGLSACNTSHNTNDRNVQIKEFRVFGPDGP